MELVEQLKTPSGPLSTTVFMPTTKDAFVSRLTKKIPSQNDIISPTKRK